MFPINVSFLLILIFIETDSIKPCFFNAPLKFLKKFLGCNSLPEGIMKARDKEAEGGLNNYSEQCMDIQNRYFIMVSFPRLRERL
jgi:hypothetical protein